MWGILSSTGLARFHARPLVRITWRAKPGVPQATSFKVHTHIHGHKWNTRIRSYMNTNTYTHIRAYRYRYICIYIRTSGRHLAGILRLVYQHHLGTRTQ